MCTIAGFNFQDEKLIKEMTDVMSHRGPDGEGFFCAENVSLGHRRLSILDLSEKGRQPMQYKNLQLTFNGEIYNFQEIKAILLEKGHEFITDTDTEVVLHAYDEWGKQCVEKFNGMWAFGLYDREKNVFFLSRDRFGIKPLYYYFDGQTFIFASELTALKKHKIVLEINSLAVNCYFYQKYIGGELTIFKNCYKLLPAHNAIFDLKSRELVKEKYFYLEKEIVAVKNLPLQSRIADIKTLLEDAVKKRLIADVPVGSFLSGGLDSSLISAIIVKNKKDFDTFSIGFREESYDEVPYSKIVAEYIGTKHHVKYVDVVDDDLINFIKKIDEPFGDSSLIPTYLLANLTREKVTVSLSGDGADEIFGGYDVYQAYKIAKMLPGFLIKIMKLFIAVIPVSGKKVTLGFKIKKFLSDYAADSQTRHLNLLSVFNEDARKKLLKKYFVADQDISLFRFPGNDLLSVQLNDIYNYLPGDILKKVDMASMHNSLEARVPYLDYRLVPLVLSLPERYKIRGLKMKWLLKNIAKTFLPARILKRKKRGFTAPLNVWIKNSKLIKSILLEEKFYQHNFIDQKEVARLYAQHIFGENDHSRKLWTIFVFNLWYQYQYVAI